MLTIFQVKFANKYSVPFLATNGVHGSITSLGKFNQGIEIKLTKLNSVTISTDGKTAEIGGGVISHDLTATLWKSNKQAGMSFFHWTTSRLQELMRTDYKHSHWNLRVCFLHGTRSGRRSWMAPRSSRPHFRPICFHEGRHRQRQEDRG